MGKRANIRATRRATEKLVQQGRAAHLREQGVLGPAGGPDEAVAYDRRAAKAETTRRRVAADASAGSPWLILAVGGAIFAAFVLMCVLGSGTGWATFGVWGSIITFFTTIFSAASARGSQDRTELRRRSS